MKLFIEKKWLLVTVAATLLLSGCSRIEQSIQDIIDTSVQNFICFSKKIVYERNYLIMKSLCFQ
ncbi:hypothetical protein A4V06_02295 [Enterococcus faecalis]|nr:hypothetical protein A4V06_02295 [Enterococcus faecalis]ASU26656.1 hypothetical protein ADH73_11635 [Enterococcus faecalis]